MHNDILRKVYTRGEIQARVNEIGARLTNDYSGKELVLIGVLKGSFVFIADLVRAADVNAEVQFVHASSYKNAANSSGSVDISEALGIDIRGKHVLVVEDIADTGRTLGKLMRHLSDKSPASLKLCVFLDKTARRDAEIKIDYTAFSCGEGFYVGYGLDYAGKYRGLPYVGELKPEVYGG